MIFSAEKPSTFACPNHSGGLTLTPSACAGMWQRARQLRHESYNPVEACCGCRIGAGHAGFEDAPEERKTGLIDHICTRCHRPATRFVYGRICISCYNRGREVIKGRNARGTAPKFLPPLISASVDYLVEGKKQHVTLEQVTDLMEARLSLVRKSSKVLALVRSVKTSESLPLNQSDLFNGLVMTRRRRPKVKGVNVSNSLKNVPSMIQQSLLGE